MFGCSVLPNDSPHPDVLRRRGRGGSFRTAPERLKAAGEGESKFDAGGSFIDQNGSRY